MFDIVVKDILSFFDKFEQYLKKYSLVTLPFIDTKLIDTSPDNSVIILANKLQKVEIKLVSLSLIQPFGKLRHKIFEWVVSSLW